MLLESMKKGVSKIVVWVLAVLLIISFAIWGIGDMVGGSQGSDEIATVGGTSISQREFQEQFQRELTRLQETIGVIDSQQARRLGLADSTLEGLISRRLMAIEAEKMGLLISDGQVVSQIQQEEAFRNSLGQFDRLQFRQALAQSGLSEGMYVAGVRSDLQRTYLGGAIGQGAASPPVLAETVFRYRNEKRAAKVIRVPRPDISKAPTPDDAALREFIEKNSAAFMAPEFRRVSLLFLSPAELAKGIAPSPERLKDEYESRLSSLSIPERRRIEQILVKDEDSAKKAHASLGEGMTFEAVAERTTGKTGDDLKLGLVTAGDLLPALATPVFAVKEGEHTEPVKTPLGWHILRVTEVQPGRQPALKEVEGEIAKDLSIELARDEAVRLANRVEDARAGGGTIEEAAAAANLQLRKPDAVNAELKNQAGTAVAGLPADQKFVETAFSLEKGETSELVETADGGYFIVRVDEIIPAARKPLEQVRDAATRAWQTAELNKLARKTAEDIRDRVKSGTPIENVARDRNLVVETGKPVTRFATASDTVLPPTILPELFKAGKGDVVLAPTPNGHAVAVLTEIQAAQPDDSDPELKRLQERLSAAMANDLLQQYTGALRKEHSVSINRTALDAYFAAR